MVLKRVLSSLAVPVVAVAIAGPAEAIVRGKVARDPNGVRSSVVRIESDGGEMCSGVVVAPDLILTAAHCVLERTNYRVYTIDRGFRSRQYRAIAAALHPTFVPGTTPRTQPGIDLALLKIAGRLGPEFQPLDPRLARRIRAGEAVTIAGFGTTAYRNKGSARTLRETYLVSLGEVQITNSVFVAVDAERLAERTGAGACQGDSGGPILREAGGRYELVGIVSWSSGAFAERKPTACGGLTAVTPVADHSDWIAARAADLARLVQGRAPPVASAGTNRFDWAARSP